MQITNMEQVKENVGKKVRFQCETMPKPTTGIIVFGDFLDCEKEEVGIENVYSVRYDNISENMFTWYSLDEEAFEEGDFVVFETIEDKNIEDYKQIIIARKDLNMSVGKLAAQVSHGSMAFLTNLLKQNCQSKEYEYFLTYDLNNVNKPALYKNPELCQESLDAFNRGEKYIKKLTGETGYDVCFRLDKDLMEQWIFGSFTKVVLEAKNKNKLLKVVEYANELGLKENEDYFLIRDNCLTELTPEDEDGRTLTVIGFKPLPEEIANKISKHYQLYK